MKTPLRRRQVAGLSLLELMLAVALGVTLTAAVVQLFGGSSRSHAALGDQARLQESARHALGFLARSARNAGYRGCASGDSVLANALHGGWEDVAELDVSRPVQGFEAVGDGVDAGDWQPGLTALPVRNSGAAPAFKSRNRINLRRLRPGSDIVAFRRVEPGVHLWPRRCSGTLMRWSSPPTAAPSERTTSFSSPRASRRRCSESPPQAPPATA